MQFDIKTGLTVAAMIVAGVSAFYTFQISTQEGINTLEDRLQRLEAQAPLGEAQIRDLVAARVASALQGRAASGVPSGAVAAFDTPNRCPEGWSAFVAAEGRFLVGATFGTQSEPGLGSDAAGAPIAQYKFRDHGGVGRVALAEAEMPAHRHDVLPGTMLGYGSGPAAFAVQETTEFEREARNVLLPRDKLRGDRDPMSQAGAGQAHENRPPFLALYFCKKD